MLCFLQSQLIQPMDHDYLETQKDAESFSVLEANKELSDILETRAQLQEESEELALLKQNGRVLSYEHLINNEKMFQYYSGLQPTVFLGLFAYLKPKADTMKYPYGSRTVLFNHHGDKYKKRPGKARSTSLEEEFFMTLVKLRLGLQNVDCAARFGVSASTFSSIFTGWVTLLSQELEKISKMPPTTEIETDSANCFSEFPNVRIIIDCTELFAERPSSVGVHKQFHSNYKHHSTVKFLVGMNTGGAITYISEMYGGRASDKFITNEAQDLLDSLNAGEKVMADRGFTIQDDLPAGVKLVIPSFKHKDKSQFSKTELQANKKISEARVHIERGIRRIKQFQILRNEMKLSQVDVYSNIFKACGYLVNFQDPFLKV